MVLRKRGWRIVTLAAAGFAAAGASPEPSHAQTTGSLVPQGNLVWGGAVPPPPRAGEAPVYVPSPAYSDGYQTPNQSAYQGPASVPPQFLPEAVAPQADVAAVPEPQPGDYGRTFPVETTPAAAPVEQAALPPLGPGRTIDDASPGGVYGSLPEDDFDPWEGLTEASPGIEPPVAPSRAPEAATPPEAVPAPAQVPAPAPAQVPAERREAAPSVPTYAALQRVEPPKAEGRGWSWNPFRWGRGSLADRTPQGWRALPREEAACRRELQSRGAQFTDSKRVGDGRTHGIANPVRVTMAAKDIAMQPPALLSCQTALQTARWLDEEVRSAARWTMWKTPSAVINASSYRVSRIAGTRTISEHALGNALDIRGLRFTDGSTFVVEPKGAFSPLEKKFQSQIRVAGCRYFGTVLGPGYNKAHDDHFHFDVKSRMRPVCK